MQFQRRLTTCLIAASACSIAVPAAAQPTASPPQSAPAPGTSSTRISGSIQVCEAARGEHRVQLEAGKRYYISATSGDFDPYLRLLRPGSEEVIAQDDDSGGNLVPRISFRPPQTAEYVVRVSSASPGSLGNYELNVEAAAPLPTLVSRATRTERVPFEVYEGELSASDPADRGKHFDDYELRLEEGETALIYVMGDDVVDTALQIFRLEDRGGELLDEADDTAMSLDPMLRFEADDAGTYVVRVIGYDEAAVGRYRLYIEAPRP